VCVIDKEQRALISGGPFRSNAWPSAAAWLVSFVAICVADARSPPTSFGLVSIADGEAYTLIRGAKLYTGTKGVTLVSGDIIETGPQAFVVVEAQGGSLLGIGPSTRLYLMPRTDSTSIVVLTGWVKADIRAAKGAPMRLLGTRIGIQSRQAVLLLHAEQHTDQVFDENGPATLLVREGAATRVSREAQTSQFFVREERTDVLSQPRPSEDFVAAMPIPFRDPLPDKASSRLKKPAFPVLVREVSYGDVQEWLTMPRDWRAGFIPRFRMRINDPIFFAAMDVHMADHPEWQPILHPPPPPEELPPPATRASSPPH
jgi:hypothetical protein